eukprot:COSAG02_NODE_6591_length_3474_cov_2.032593_1_plen_760_part_00
MGGTLSVDKREGRRLHSRDFVKVIESCRKADAALCVPTDKEAVALTVVPGTVAVVVRVRPLFPHETAKGEFNVISCGAGGTQIAVHLTSLPRGIGFDGELETHRFEAQHVFDDACSNDDVFCHSVLPLVDFAIGGGQSTAFMFGQTGSGKTYTMSAMYERAAARCFAGLDSTTVRVSFVELVGDSARDLLRSGDDGAPAPVRLLTDAEGCVQLSNAMELEVTSAQELTGAIAQAIELRRQAGTAVHDQSSRSHAVCRIQLPAQEAGGGVLTLVDLAGSERNAATLHKSDPKLIREAAQINSSLMALKDCIRARAVGQYANFRASKLTQLLKSSFEHPNAALVCITTISPSAGDTEYSLSSLTHAVLMASDDTPEGEAAAQETNLSRKDVLVVPVAQSALIGKAETSGSCPEPEPEAEPDLDGDGNEIMSRDEARSRLHSVYTAHMPSKLYAIPSLLDKYAANPSDIVKKVEDKYLTPPSSAGELMKQNKRMKAARALVQQKAVIARSWSMWYDDMRAGIPCKLWPLPGEALPPPTAELPSGGGHIRHEPGGAAEWLASSWEHWRTGRPAWFTPKWQHAIPAHFLPPGAELDEYVEGTNDVEEEQIQAHVFGGPGAVLPQPPPPPPDIRASYQSIMQSVDDPNPPPAVIAAPQWEIPVKSWLTEQPWRTFKTSTQQPTDPDGLQEVEVGVDDYRVRPSALQSCASGMIMLDVDCIADWSDAPKVPAGDHVAERLRLSRVIEVDVQSGAVMTVLAARDSPQ